MTSYKSFADRGEVFNDQVLATAILDRLLHHATTLNIKGESYWLREKKAGLLGRRSVIAADHCRHLTPSLQSGQETLSSME